MKSLHMRKLCLVQPSNDYQVLSHQHALALTFPYLIKKLSLTDGFDVSLYVEGKTNKIFDDYLSKENPEFVFITANTATFPNAVKLAQIAKNQKCRVLLGGLFASMNYDVIHKYYTCFDKIIIGAPNSYSIFDKIEKKTVNKCDNSYDINFGIHDVLNLPMFEEYDNDPVCYEITFGCAYNCNYCSLRYVWGTGVCSKRNITTITEDLNKLTKWKTLKIIDDDILQSKEIIGKCKVPNNFKKVIAETRVDRINENTVSILKDFGVTHLIIGVESFNADNLYNSNKTNSQKWTKETFKALEICNKHNIISRPVMQLLYPNMPKSYMKSLLLQIKDWTPQNNVEVFFSFFTPHPGMTISRNIINNLITTNLSIYDHLTPVYKPDDYNIKDLHNVICEYNKLVDLTNSLEYNPHINYINDHCTGEFDHFFY